MTESLRAKMMKKKEAIKSNPRSDKYLSFFGTVIILVVTFILGFVAGLAVGKWF